MPLRLSSTRSFQRLRLGPVVLLLVALVAPGRAAPPDSDLRLVVMLTRHGVRSPLYTNEDLGQFAAQPWPDWSVPKGFLTPHGRQQMTLLGAYCRALYVSAGLLSGAPPADRSVVCFRTDSDQRTRETAHDFAAGLLPGVTVEPQARPQNRLDPLFRAAQLPIGHPDRTLGAAAVAGSIGGDQTAMLQALAPEFATLHRVLFGDAAPAPGKQDVRNLTAMITPGTADHTVSLDGPLHTAMQITDNLMLEYAEGMPMAQVGWGRLTPADLTQLIRLHSLYFNLAHATFYPAQVQASDLASHILLTLEQAANSRPTAGAFGSPQNKLVVLVGHDTNLISLGGLLGLSWWLPGTQPNPLLPGGALVFELRQRRSDHQFFIRTYYLSQTLEQTRNLDLLTLDHPPARAPIFIPGCSTAGPGYDAPLAAFAALTHRVVNPDFVLADPN
ncbi:MAG: histidine-type phosphatase [Opitutales bacterium]